MNPSNNPNEMDKENNSPAGNSQLQPPRRSPPAVSPINGLEEAEKIQAVLAAFQEKLDQVQRRSGNLESVVHTHKNDILDKMQLDLDQEKKLNADQAVEIAQLKARIVQLETTVETSKTNGLRQNERVISLERSIKLALDAGSETHKMIEYAENVTTAISVEFDKLKARQKKLEEGLKRNKNGQSVAGTTSVAASGVPPVPPPQTAPQGRNSMIAGTNGTSSNSNSGTGQLPYPAMVVPTIRIVAGAGAKRTNGTSVTTQMGASSPRPSTSWAVFQQQSAPGPSTQIQGQRSQTQAGGQAVASSSSGNVGAPAYNLREQQSTMLSQNPVRNPSQFGIKFAECEKCAKFFTSRRVLDEHARKDALCWRDAPTSRGKNYEHGILSADKKTDKFFCVCDRTLGRPRAAFMQHFVYYRAERKFLCQPCELNFLYKSNINSHMQTRTHKKNLAEWNAKNARNVNGNGV